MTPMDERAVFVVDDDPAALRSVTALVGSLNYPARPFASAEEFLRALQPGWRGCVVTDLKMPGMSGIELQEELIRRDLPMPLILITAYAETRLTVQAMKNDAITVLEKPCNDQELSRAIQNALRFEEHQFHDQAEMNEIVERLNNLTEKEHEVLRYVMDGVPNRVIAKRLDVSTRTVELRRQQIYAKTKTRSVAELVRKVTMARQKKPV